ncbi:dihydropteroate synthase [Clostridium sp. MB40-C1]|uniref:dihydropteroate synthase n=1 Tax=Clostridium sp. MB40-C1 TaxID=3070996 RepID=UPI0027DFB20A|nr:dihydropteroate synthase [Clostridium sp. MB40-C1]WMJ80907.1 dihydropteroate synthase [Clostridium sp. MB40-C1]
MIIGNKQFNFGERTYIMGILNVTPDSFSDGGRYNNIEAAVIHAKKMIQEGADIIDIGGESTRPGHIFVPEDEEVKRVVPIIKALSNEINVPISIDTYKAQVAREAVKAGASLINDIWGFKKDKEIAKVAAEYKVACCLMHNREDKNYNNIIEDMLEDLKESIDIALKAGVEKDKIIIDPGIGFAKTYEDNLKVMKNLEKFNVLGYPVLLGTSRKSMIGFALDLPTDERLEGTIATTVIGITKGCDFVRVHDVKENKRASIMTDKIIRSL